MSTAEVGARDGRLAAAVAKLDCIPFGAAAARSFSRGTEGAGGVTSMRGGPSLFGAARFSAPRRLGAALSRAVNSAPREKISRTVLMMDVGSNGVTEPSASFGGRTLDPGAMV